MDSDLQKSIRESQKIHDGPPERYQLKPKRENLDDKDDENSELRRFTLGVRNPDVDHRTLLLVGATGSGKSTLINALVNHVMGVKFEDKIWFEIIADEEVRDQSESQTSAVSVYEIFGFEGKVVPYSLTVVDTPGFADTRGLDYDDVITKNLKLLFSDGNGVCSIDAVGLVIKATENRVDPRLAYIFNSLTSLFAKDLQQNIVAMMTHSDGGKPRNALKAMDKADIKCARDAKNEPRYFLFNNRQNEKIEDDSDDEAQAERSFEDSTKGMKKFSVFLKEASGKAVTQTLKVMDNREQLTACVQNLRERVTSIEKQQEAITANQEKLKQCKDEMERNENFTVEMKETYKEQESMHHLKKDKAVTCEDCKENCHNPCDHWYRWSCSVWSGDNCTVCRGRCPKERHVREKFRWVDRERTVTMTRDDLKEKYEEGKKGVKEQTSVLEGMKMKLVFLQQEKNQCLDKAFRKIEKLEQIALNADAASTAEHLDFLIEKMREKEDMQKVDKLTAMKDRMGGKAKEAAAYSKKMKMQ